MNDKHVELAMAYASDNIATCFPYLGYYFSELGKYISFRRVLSKTLQHTERKAAAVVKNYSIFLFW
jgi:hypothetical protein